MFKTAARLSAGVTAGLLIAVALPTAAHATISPEDRSLGGWYIDHLKFDEIAQKATGKGVKIAVIDELINPDVPELEGANVKIMQGACMDINTYEPVDPITTDPVIGYHGTNHVAMLVGNGKSADGQPGTRGIAPDAEVWFYSNGPTPSADNGVDEYWSHCIPMDPSKEKGGKSLLWDEEGMYFPNPGKGTDPAIISNDDAVGGVAEYGEGAITSFGDSTAIAARAAIKDGADIISLSIDSGRVGSWSNVIKMGNEAGVPVFIGTENPTDNIFEGGLIKTYQANGMFPVNGYTEEIKQMGAGFEYAANGSSNLFGMSPGMNLLGVGDKQGWGSALVHGTSFATPLTAGMVALGLEAFPDASAFQITQSLIHTSGPSGNPDAQRFQQWEGFGQMNPSNMLNDDPTQYPDVNPMYLTDPTSDLCINSRYADDPTAKSEAEIDDMGWYWNCEWALHPTPESFALDEVRIYEEAVGPVVYNSKGRSIETPAESVLPLALLGGSVTFLLPLLVIGSILIWRVVRLKTEPTLRVDSDAVINFDPQGRAIVTDDRAGARHYLGLYLPTSSAALNIKFWMNPETSQRVVSELAKMKALQINPQGMVDQNGVTHHEANITGKLLKVQRDSQAYFRKQFKKQQKKAAKNKA